MTSDHTQPTPAPFLRVVRGSPTPEETAALVAVLTARARAIQAQIDRGVAMCRTECECFGICGGGSPGNKYYEHGTFAAAETLKCALQTKELVEVVVRGRVSA